MAIAFSQRADDTVSCRCFAVLLLIELFCTVSVSGGAQV